MKKCDHIIGEWQGVDEGGVLRLSSWDTGNNSDVERFKFCPKCGKNISKLKPKKEKVEVIHRSPLEQAFMDASSEMFFEQAKKMAKRPGFLTALGEMDGSKVESVTFERSFTTPETP